MKKLTTQQIGDLMKVMRVMTTTDLLGVVCMASVIVCQRIDHEARATPRDRRIADRLRDTLNFCQNQMEIADDAKD